MKRMRKGFTLIELLIVIAIIGALSSIMAFASSGAVDSADANKIINNLQSLKVAAMQMYMDEPEAASLTSIAFAGTTEVGTAPNTKTISEILGSYLGKKKDAFTSTGGAKKYGLVGNSTSWYVVYQLDKNDSTGVKNKLADKANEADLLTLGVMPFIPTNEPAYYTVADANTYIALKVR